MTKTFRQFLDSLDVTKKGYKVNKWITNGAFILLLIYMMFVVSVDGVDVLRGTVFIECPIDSAQDCVNPFYDPSCEWTSKECVDVYLLRGTSIGERPSIYARSFPLVSLLVVLGSLLLNHQLYNKGYWRSKKNG